jgi:hypothetical protein
LPSSEENDSGAGSEEDPRSERKFIHGTVPKEKEKGDREKRVYVGIGSVAKEVIPKGSRAHQQGQGHEPPPLSENPPERSIGQQKGQPPIKPTGEDLGEHVWRREEMMETPLGVTSETEVTKVSGQKKGKLEEARTEGERVGSVPAFLDSVKIGPRRTHVIPVELIGQIEVEAPD